MTFRSEYPTGIVLCIDDDEAVLRYEKALLEQFGYKILTAMSGREGLRLAAIWELDLVVLDYSMPGMNGHEVASVIKRIRPELKVVMLSGGDVPAHALASVDAFVEKPNASHQLLPIVAELCRTPNDSPRSVLNGRNSAGGLTWRDWVSRRNETLLFAVLMVLALLFRLYFT